MGIAYRRGRREGGGREAHPSINCVASAPHREEEEEEEEELKQHPFRYPPTTKRDKDLRPISMTPHRILTAVYALLHSGSF